MAAAAGAMIGTAACVPVPRSSFAGATTVSARRTALIGAAA